MLDSVLSRLRELVAELDHFGLSVAAALVSEAIDRIEREHEIIH